MSAELTRIPRQDLRASLDGLHYENLKSGFPVTGLRYKKILPILIKLGCLTLKVAQLVAHMTCNHDVAGSTPAFRKSWV